MVYSHERIHVMTSKKIPLVDVSEKETEESSTEELAPEALESDAQKEFNGPKGPEPTRYGDWEKNGRCIDF